MLAGAVFTLLYPAADASPFHRSGESTTARGSGASLRKRLHVNDLIAEPGTVEIDWGTLFSFTTDGLSLPSAVKYTPDGKSLFWGRTEYSLSFDSAASAVTAGVRTTQFSDRLTFAATSVVFDSQHFDVAVAPQVTTFLRGESGLRLGATVIARYDGYGNSLGFTTSWTAGTRTSDANPAGAWDFGVGYGRRLGRVRFLRKLTPHVNVTAEKATGFDRTHAVFAGMEYQMTERFAIDVSGQRYYLNGGAADRQILASVTWNLGHTK